MYLVRLDYPSEYLTWVSCRVVIGTFGAFGDGISSLTFGTNRTKRGPFGCPTEGDREFRIQLGPERQFGGFHGTTIDNRDRLGSIGVYLKPIKTLGKFQDKSASPFYLVPRAGFDKNSK
ncbi:unnamed protein product [Ilex paraguariensis]|uniref:Jacalin-type lectin domain-containing protein n=1 Tax=Ilex paraguariensis TaxID=185542 RepID=A0ABC8T515_9AQUA